MSRLPAGQDLGLLFGIDMDPSAALAATDKLADQLTGKVQAAIQAATASTEQMRSGMLAFGEDINGANSSMMGFAETLGVDAEGGGGGGKPTVSRGFANARISAMGLSQELGLGLPRALTSFLAQSETIGPILSAAFSVVAVIGFIELIERLPALFEKAEEKVTGWDKAAKKAFEEEIVLVDDLRKKIDDYALTLMKAETIALDLKGSQARKRSQEEINKELELTGSRIDGLTEKQRIYQAEAKKLNDDFLIQEQLGSDISIFQALEYGKLIDQSKAIQAEINKEKDAREKLLSELPIKEAQVQSAITEEKKKAGEAAIRIAKHVAEENARAAAQFDKAVEAGILKEERDEETMAAAILAIREGMYRSETMMKEKAVKDAEKLDHDEMVMAEATARIYEGMAKSEEILAKDAETARLKEFHADIEQIQQMERAHTHAYELKIKQLKAEESTTLSVLDAAAGAFRQSHAIEVGLIIAKAGIKALFEVAEGSAAAARGDFPSAALHYKAAVEYAVVGAISAAGAAFSGGGGSSGSGGGGGNQSPSANQSQIANTPLAQGARSGGPIHVIVLGEAAGAQHIAGMLNTNSRSGGLLIATHVTKTG